MSKPAGVPRCCYHGTAGREPSAPHCHACAQTGRCRCTDCRQVELTGPPPYEGAGKRGSGPRACFAAAALPGPDLAARGL